MVFIIDLDEKLYKTASKYTYLTSTSQLQDTNTFCPKITFIVIALGALMKKIICLHTVLNKKVSFCNKVFYYVLRIACVLEFLCFGICMCLVSRSHCRVPVFLLGIFSLL